MTELSKLIEGFKKGEVEVIDTRDFDSYSQRHIPETVLAPFYERRWPDEIAEYLKGKKGEVLFLSDSHEKIEKIDKLLKERGLHPQIVEYDKFLKEGNFKEVGMENLTPEQFADRIDEFTVIDVREPYEWQGGYIDGAELIPIQELFSSYKKLSTDKKYAIVCEHGNRSIYAAMFLADKGFKVANVEGGMNELRGRGIV